jgi:hypothetical protein
MDWFGCFLCLAVNWALVFGGSSSLSQEQCLTYGQDLSHLQSHRSLNETDSSSFFVCQAGQWPLEQTCHSSGIAISLEIINKDVHLFHHHSLPPEVSHSWQMNSEINFTPRCSHLYENIVFLPIPFDPKAYQSDGSNYYVIHVDLLLPFWNFLQNVLSQSNKDPQDTKIFLFPFNGQSFRDVSHNSTVFFDPKKYWIHALQILSELSLLIPGDAHGITQFPHRSRREAEQYERLSQTSRLCFRKIQIGLPRYDRPSMASLRRFSSRYRQVLVRPLVLSSRQCISSLITLVL